jgi:hypothetical protein
MHFGKNCASLTIQARGSIMGLRTRGLAVVTIYTKRLIDEQNVGGLSEPLLKQKIENAARFLRALIAHIIFQTATDHFRNTGSKILI